MTTWHVLAPEFPPGCGGVGEYSALLVDALRQAGDRVRVWHPGVLPDRFGPLARNAIDAAFAADPGPLLVQYVPSAFGMRGMNLPFCLWLRRLRRRGADVRVMFHEPFFYFGARRPWRNGLAIVQRVMAAVLLRAATRVYYSTETWTRLLAPFGPQQHVEVLPIPSTVPFPGAAPAPGKAPASASGAPIVGHFGTYGEHVAGELLPTLREIAGRQASARFLLAGRGSVAFAATLEPDLRSRADVVDAADGAAIARALGSCDVLVQPYPDGVTTRRTSIMAALTSGVPVVTTRGALTEQVWTESEAVALVPAGSPGTLAAKTIELAADPASGRELAARARRLYDERFALPVTLAKIRRP